MSGLSWLHEHVPALVALSNRVFGVWKRRDVHVPEGQEITGGKSSVSRWCTAAWITIPISYQFFQEVATARLGGLDGSESGNG